MSYTVESLHRFPVKSMLGEDIDFSLVTPAGLAGDRAYALLEPKTKRIGTAKVVRKWGPLFQCHARYDREPVADGLTSAQITLPDGVEVSTDAVDIDSTFTKLLGREVRLINGKQEGLKLESPALGKVPESDDDPTVDFPVVNGFFDAMAVHLLTTATLRRLSTLNPSGRFKSRRFRPNVVVDTPGEGFLENDWVGKTLIIGSDLRLKILSPAIRCVVTTHAQGDLPQDSSILKTAAEHNNANVGVYAMVQQSGMIRVGDEVVVSS
ncbi:MAG: MOSC domain-containing protein [Chloroflexi bacterium]|nr:MOSC domain-containing protein [Chloroflexota bacterium]